MARGFPSSGSSGYLNWMALGLVIDIEHRGYLLLLQEIGIAEINNAVLQEEKSSEKVSKKTEEFSFFNFLQLLFVRIATVWEK